MGSMVTGLATGERTGHMDSSIFESEGTINKSLIETSEVPCEMTDFDHPKPRKKTLSPSVSLC